MSCTSNRLGKRRQIGCYMIDWFFRLNTIAHVSWLDSIALIKCIVDVHRRWVYFKCRGWIFISSMPRNSWRAIIEQLRLILERKLGVGRKQPIELNSDTKTTSLLVLASVTYIFEKSMRTDGGSWYFLSFCSGRRFLFYFMHCRSNAVLVCHILQSFFEGWR